MLRLQPSLAPQTWSSSSSDSPTTPLSSRSPRLGTQPGLPTWACLLETPTRTSALAGADSSDAFQNLRNARRLVRDMRHARQHVVLSPRLVKSLTSRSERPDLIQKLSALKPGALDVDSGFLRVRLETGHTGTAGTLDVMPTVGSGASASTYAVRLAEDLWQDGQKLRTRLHLQGLVAHQPATAGPTDTERPHLRCRRTGASATDRCAQGHDLPGISNDQVGRCGALYRPRPRRGADRTHLRNFCWKNRRHQRAQHDWPRTQSAATRRHHRNGVSRPGPAADGRCPGGDCLLRRRRHRASGHLAQQRHVRPTHEDLSADRHGGSAQKKATQTAAAHRGFTT